jgi:hypothetical protein
MFFSALFTLIFPKLCFPPFECRSFKTRILKTNKETLSFSRSSFLMPILREHIEWTFEYENYMVCGIVSYDYNKLSLQTSPANNFHHSSFILKKLIITLTDDLPGQPFLSNSIMELLEGCLK